MYSRYQYLFPANHEIAANTKRPEKVIGLDTVLAIMNVMYEGYGDCKSRPCSLLRQYVKAGWLGKKSGRGFYKYE